MICGHILVEEFHHGPSAVLMFQYTIFTEEFHILNWWAYYISGHQKSWWHMVGLAIAESGFPAWCSTTYNKISDDKT